MLSVNIAVYVNVNAKSADVDHFPPYSAICVHIKAVNHYWRIHIPHINLTVQFSEITNDSIILDANVCYISIFLH